jgi:hypothetical protein
MADYFENRIESLGSIIRREYVEQISVLHRVLHRVYLDLST